MILKNVTDGPKVLNTLAGPVTVPAGGQSDDVEMAEAEQLSAIDIGWFEEVEAEKPKPKAPAKPAKE